VSERFKDDLIAWFFILLFIVVLVLLGVTHH